MLFEYSLVIILLVLVIVLVRKRPKKFLDLHKQIKVSFPDVPVIGHAYKLIGTNEDRMMFVDELSRQSYKNKYSVASLWVFNDFYVSISDPVSARVVLKSCSDKRPMSLFARHLLGNGSIFADEEIWRLRRKILTPLFAPKYFNNFVQVFERNSKIMMEELAAVVGRGDFSIWEYFSSYSLDSALDMTFGENAAAQQHRRHPFVVAFQEYFTLIAARVSQPWLYGDALYALLPAAARQRRNRNLIWEFVQNLILKKKAEMSKDQNTSNTSNNATFLELLMEHSRGVGGYSDTELREETLVLLLAATDTTATAACFAAVLLARHPPVQDAVHREIQKLLENSKRSVTIDDLAKLKYLDAVVKESLRLYPPAPVAVRTCNRDVELPSGLVLHEGSLALLNIWGVHRNPHCWGADAAEFKPERFLRATPDQLAAFMPFGHGPRSCTGPRLALASVKLTLAELTRRYRVTPAGGELGGSERGGSERGGSECGGSEGWGSGRDGSERWSSESGGSERGGSTRTALRVSYDIMLKHVHGFKVRLENRC